MNNQIEKQSDSVGYPSAIPAWWMVSVLCLAGVFSVIDRSVLNIMVDPIRQDLHISDVQISLLQGLAFGFFYAFMGIPLGLTADRVSRKWLIIGGITLWSLATVFSGFASNFAQLFTARLLVGLGEAALGPAAISLIGDLFSPEKRGRPTSVYVMGQGLATGLAITVTGVILNWALAGHFEGLPIFSDLEPWRITFVVCGMGGFLVALALVTTREPTRKNVVSAANKGIGAEEFKFFSENKSVFIPLYLGFAMCFMAAYGAAAWMPTMLIRTHGANPSFLASWLGPMTMVFSLVGPFLAGYLLDVRTKLGDTNIRFYILIGAPFLAMISALSYFGIGLMPATLLVASNNAAFAMIGTTLFVVLQTIVPSNMRGISIAITGVVNTILGASLGPLFVAMLTEHVFKDPNLVGLSIAVVMIPALLIATLLFFMAWKAVRIKGL